MPTPVQKFKEGDRVRCLYQFDKCKDPQPTFGTVKDVVMHIMKDYYFYYTVFDGFMDGYPLQMKAEDLELAQ